MFIKSGFLLLLLYAMQANAYPGFRQLELTDRQERTLKLAVWYPSVTPGKIEKTGENAAFEGVSVIRDAPPAQGQHPLLVISHGYNGSWRNMSWLAQIMAMQGYIVAAPDHPGTTTFNQNPDEARKLWQRPLDITRVIDFITGSPRLVGETDNSRIAALGHSLGGWTVLSLAGAQFNARQFINDCQSRPQRNDCVLIEKLGINSDLTREKLSANYRDARIHAIVSLDLGLAPGFTQQSLRQIDRPVLILAAQGDNVIRLPAAQESGYLATWIKPHWREYDVIAGATHFSFMQLCKAGAESLLNRESPGDGIICRDQKGFNRIDLHQKLAVKISAFLNASLNFPAAADGKPSERRQQRVETRD